LIAIKQLQPEASNRRIAKVLGANPSTIDADVAGNPARAGKKASDPNDALGGAAGNPAVLTGADAARAVERAE
jgi:hypothetical protein